MNPRFSVWNSSCPMCKLPCTLCSAIAFLQDMLLYLAPQYPKDDAYAVQEAVRSSASALDWLSRLAAEDIPDVQYLDLFTEGLKDD